MKNRIEIIKGEDGQYCERELIYAPTAWQKAGLQETATGYGRRLNSGYKVHFAGKLRRVYAICYSNCASFYVHVNGKITMLGI